jgi:carbamoyl-phosphate synthase large subunit
MTETITILLTCVGGPLVPRAIELLKASKNHQFRVVGIDAAEDAVGAPWCDVFETAPMGDDPAYCDVILGLCQREGIQVVIPWSDEEAFAIAHARDRFEDLGIAVAAPTLEVSAIAGNKADALDWLKQQNVPVPDYRRVSTLDELRSAAAEMGYPDKMLALKPCVAHGGRGVWALRGEGPRLNELLHEVALDVISLDTFVAAAGTADIPEMLLMPFLTGTVYDVDILQDGEVLHYMVPRRRFHVRTNPFRGCIIHRNEAVLELAKSVQDALKMRCLYDIDIILDADDKPWILEINPRISASVVATMEAGVPMLEYLIRMILGHDIPQIQIPYDQRIRPYIALSSDGYEL